MYIAPKIIRKIFGVAAVKKTVKYKSAKIDNGSVVVDTTLGIYSYIGEHSTVLDAKIGGFTSISNYCAIGGGTHTVDWVSTSPVFNSSTSILHKNLARHEFNPFEKTIIGNDVWIGSHCLIKGGTHIADGAVVGMGSVVTKDIGPYEIWAGNPARMIRKRFDDETIKKLMKAKWWEWDVEKIKNSAQFFHSVDAFLESENL